jgi:acetylornithine/succinyldiaminopimelate/putrescine aminotransferase
MVGLEFTTPRAKAVLQALFRAGIVANATSDTVLRFVPPLTVTTADCDRVVQALKEALLSET